MIPSFLLEKENTRFKELAKSNRITFVDRTIKNVASFVNTTFLQCLSSRKNGFLQKLDSRVKVVFMVFFVILTSVTTALNNQLIIASVIFLLCLLSRLNIIHLYKRVVIAGFVFGFLVFIPASLNIFTRGENVAPLIRFVNEKHLWIYTIPKEIYFTYEGIVLVIRLTLKVINSVSVVMLVMTTTTFEKVVKSFSFFRVPDIFLLTLTLTYKFIFILSRTVVETYQAIKMRWWNRGIGIDAEEIVAGRIGYLFRKSWERYELVYQSMIARGYNGKVDFCYFEKLNRTDYFFTIAFMVIFSTLVLINYFHA
jgi:cobalt/nickel transport system permease protein